MSARKDDRFVAGALQGALPFLIWAAHFFLVYMTIKGACALNLQHSTLGGVAVISAAIWLLSAAAIAALLALGVLWARAARAHRIGAGGTLGVVRLGAVVFALVAVVWSTVPIVLVPPCSNANLRSTQPGLSGHDFAAATAFFSATPSTLAICVVR